MNCPKHSTIELYQDMTKTEGYCEICRKWYKLEYPPEEEEEENQKWNGLLRLVKLKEEEIAYLVALTGYCLKDRVEVEVPEWISNSQFTIAANIYNKLTEQE